MRLHLLFALTVLVALTGCAEPLPALTPTPGELAEAVLADYAGATATRGTAHVTPAASAGTATPSPTRTSTATRTPSPTPSVTATWTQTPSPAPTATPTLVPTPTRYPTPSGNITRIDTTFRSAALGMDREIIIYLPPGYGAQAQRRYPVLYVLHGWGGADLKHTTEWEQWGLPDVVQDLTVKGAIQPLIVVQPNGFMPDGQCSLFFNHGPGTDGKPWGDYVWNDVVKYVDATYRTLPRRESRAIGGFSFGGQGALSLGLSHPEVFKVVGAHSPSFRDADGSIGYLNDAEWFSAFDPIWLVENTENARQLALWIDVAAGDDKVRNCGEGSDRCVEAFHALLVSRGIPHAWEDAWPGPHEGTYWEGHLPDYLAWYSSQLLGQ